MFVIVGLGNPGQKYKNTRHNMGFEVIDYLSEAYEIPLNKVEHKGITGRGFIGAGKVILAKPHTYMNLSGSMVLSLVNFYKIPMDKLIIIYDDIHLPLGKVQVKRNGSSGGQRGMENIMERLDSQDISRVRVGIGPPPIKMDVVDYVLGKIHTKTDLEKRKMGIDRAADAIKYIVNQGINEAMNEINGLTVLDLGTNVEK